MKAFSEISSPFTYSSYSFGDFEGHFFAQTPERCLTRLLGGTFRCRRPGAPPPHLFPPALETAKSWQFSPLGLVRPVRHPLFEAVLVNRNFPSNLPVSGLSATYINLWFPLPRHQRPIKSGRKLAAGCLSRLCPWTTPPLPMRFGLTPCTTPCGVSPLLPLLANEKIHPAPPCMPRPTASSVMLLFFSFFLPRFPAAISGWFFLRFHCRATQRHPPPAVSPNRFPSSA